MDYVREELLRQRAVLAALMTGGIREAEAAAETENAMPVELAGSSGRLREKRNDGKGMRTMDAYARTEDAFMTEAVGGSRQGTEGISPLEEKGLLESGGRAQMRRRRARGSGSGISGKAGLAREKTPAVFPLAMAGTAGIFSHSGIGLPGEVSSAGANTAGMVFPSGTEMSAGIREVSRAIQRDARRYDGGFSIY